MNEKTGEHRVLVTGATGTVGRSLVAQLSNNPVTVRVATRAPSKARERLGNGPEYVEFDLHRPETWGAVLEDVDRMFLLIPPTVGVASVRRFADAAGRVGVDHVTYLSILGAEKLPILPHRRVEKHLAGTDMTWTFLRASYFMQNLSGIHRPEIVERDEIFIPAGNGVVSFVDARDVAAVAATVLTAPGHGNRTYDLTGPEAVDFAAVADAFSDVLDRRVTYARPSRLAFARHMYRRGVPTPMVAFMTVEYSIIRLSLSGRTTNDVAAVLGRPPRTVRQFVADHVDEFRPE
ncbi:NAD(P)-dependent oxidoreductase [Haladaptatus sp. W1]|uniref:NmrA family NAD(P)-binding protein n=1 Tax=Haladaptatus sp. W1 TaxID=1897478 RepID=UPI000849E46F|nr:NmrA family NAD(P)-binding protein [Haladaptatus sp. W1]ODR83062.1 NAD(P)-dependent oxidoreductase [Haladaptatus sp. W1]